MRLKVTLLITLVLVCKSLFSQSIDVLPANAVVPYIPQSLTFAGERVPLENYDTRESLQRELLVTMYTHSKTLLALLRTTRYFPIIEPILKKNNIPSDFKYLCMAESALDPTAVSGAKAAGLWQFMPATGTSFGLFVDSGVDERFDLEKSTEAACRYFNAMYDSLGSWSMVAAAFNLGRTGVLKRKNLQGVDNYFDLYLPWETMRYVFRIVAFKLIVENPERYGFRISPPQYYKPLNDFIEIKISDAQIDWSQVALANGTNYKMLRELNHWIRDYKYNNPNRREFTVKIPSKKLRNQ